MARDKEGIDKILIFCDEDAVLIIHVFKNFSVSRFIPFGKFKRMHGTMTGFFYQLSEFSGKLSIKFESLVRNEKLTREYFDSLVNFLREGAAKLIVYGCD